MSRAGMDLEFEGVFRRISEQTDLKTSTNLAEFLGISSASVSKQKTGNTFPASWAILIAKQYNLDLNYIVFGKKYADKMRKDDEDMNLLIKNYVEKKYDFELKDGDYVLKALSGEIVFFVERFLDHIKR
ncbi:helix-turn-helix domain containing protein [Desulfomicrobium sp. ZS1]|uniref:helix-turn-helix domain-containing protein n=1 Tax=Desulfomicrobium sp. ZS1 TaxID=2952228 RepID=UPI0020B379DC|nr:helix-turn-helix domain-containing protein [Desulfomicrobium sp. ZS1]UTF51822.1 helix-turn-helix domain containing protein [Desulfomicrobium sp. ZS1]